MTALLQGALVGLAFWALASSLLGLAFCAVRARDNARIRKARRENAAEALELALMRREFDAIVARLKADA